jgi:hypothetical protein
MQVIGLLMFPFELGFCWIYVAHYNILAKYIHKSQPPIWDPDLGPWFGTLIWDPDLGPPFGTPILGGDMGPRYVWDPKLGPRYGTAFWDPDLGPQFGTLIWDPDIGGGMGFGEWYFGPTLRTPIIELMSNVISKIKQNSSDMNEIILAPCDAGYVQSCTG